LEATSTASHDSEHAVVVAPPVVVRDALFETLSAAERAGGVTLVSAPAGSGKTVLLRSWLHAAGLGDHAAWVSVDRSERDVQRFWLAVIEGLRAAVGTDAFVERLAPTPEFEGSAVVERLLSGLQSLEEPAVLVIDDLQELASPEALAQLEVLLAQRPASLRIVLATRRDPQLGLHRLRLAGQLTEIRATDLRFTLKEACELLANSGVTLSDQSITLLHARTEGWAVGLRLAALSLAGHPGASRPLRSRRPAAGHPSRSSGSRLRRSPGSKSCKDGSRRHGPGSSAPRRPCAQAWSLPPNCCFIS
jgi:LuxR family transcriptional regulator, maltose regulon positive regulatory protein